jgi:predicted nucleic acid-binding protein
VNVLVDTSVWVDYFRGGSMGLVDQLIEEDLIATNDLILAELIPPLRVRKERTLIGLLGEIRRYPVSVDWDDIIRTQTTCLRHGINGVGIPDLIIAQNAVQHNLRLLTNDKHFELLSEHVPLKLQG